jgi:transposase
MSDLRQKQMTFVERLCQLCPEVKTAQELALGFVGMVKERRAADLDAWLEVATTSSVAELKGVAKSLRQDMAAVKAALSSEVSNGQVEGQVNRLKLIKRSMYGRAKLDLLRARVLPMQQAA